MAGGGAGWRPPPAWPVPPESWQPAVGWRPDPRWPSPPAGWVFRPEIAGLARRWAALTVVLIAAVLALYLAIIHAQGDGRPAYWFVAVLAVAALAALCATVVSRLRFPLLTACAGLLAPCVLLGLLSIGVLITPALGSAVAGAVMQRRAQRPG